MATRFATANPVEPMLGEHDALNLRTQFNALVIDVAALATLLATYRTWITEMASDHATFKTVVDEVKASVNALGVDAAARLTKYNATLAKLDADAGVTDTNYAATNPFAAPTFAAVSNSAPATLSSATPAATAAATGLALTEV